MTNKVAFFYLHGTDPILAQIAGAVGQVFQQPRLGLLTVPGLNGTTTWPDGSPRNDPFCNLLDANVFEAKKVGYPALGIPMSLSMTVGINNLVAAINALPKGQKFMIGGYSQGAACASSVELMLRPGGSLYSSRGADYLGGCVFGNPRRQDGGYRGEVGGTWSGAWDVPGSTTGGRGVFSATGPFPRLTGCNPTKWIEFTEEGDIFSSTGTSATGLNWTEATNAFLDLLNLPAVINAIFNLLDDVGEAFTAGGLVNTYTDAVGRVFNFPGGGHAAYPWRPPPGETGLTSYQLAVQWLTGKATASATAPILLPTNPISTSSAGWTTTLIPPAS